jgi:hypothetical protein
MMNYRTRMAAFAFTLFVAALALPGVALAQDCCGPESSSCCPGDLITGGGLLAAGVEVAEATAEEADQPATHGPDEALGKLLLKLMNKLGYGEGGGGDEDADESTASKPTIPAAEIEAIYAALYDLKVGSRVTGPSGSGKGKFTLVVKKATRKPFSRTFVYKPSKKARPLLIIWKETAKGFSVTAKRKK